MCIECRQTPCHSCCPNAVHTLVCECEMCGNGIYEGEPMYVIGAEKFCEDCIDSCKTFAELEDVNI